MRSYVAAAAVVTVLATGLATAQMKSAVPQTPSTATTALPRATTATPIPVQQAPLEAARRISREEAISLIKAKKAIFVDVRPKDQYDAGHIRQAISIPLGDILKRVREIPPKQMIITYCA